VIRRWSFLLPLVAIGVACGERTPDVIGYDSTPEERGFTSADAGGTEDQDASTSEPVAMCPVTTCSFPWTTCPSSKFPCSTNLLSDDENCGGCGIRCPGRVGQTARWQCVDGKCAFSCNTLGTMNCDGDYSNGCEASVTTNKNHCGICGNRCPDGMVCDQATCIDPCLRQNLPDKCDGTCTNLEADPHNCGACGNACDPTGPNLPPLPADMKYGCRSGRAGDPCALII
jgi:hypothetical protein